MGERAMADARRPFTTARRAGVWVLRGVFRVVRLSFVWVGLLVAFGLVAARISMARASDLGQHFGDELLQIGERHIASDVPEDVYQIGINGQRFRSSNASSHRSMGELLDYFQEECRHHAGGLRDSFAHLDATVATLAPASGTDGALVLRRDSGDRGYVFCVAPDHALSTTEKIRRLRAMSRTGDLTTVGEMRYVAVRDTAKGTDVVTAWTEGSFVLWRMFPPSGDAPGEDFGGVPRPEAARRVFSGSLEKAPFGVNIYEAPGEVPAVLADVESRLSAVGWKRQSGGPDVPETGRFYSLGNSLDLVLSVAPAGHGMARATYVVSRNVGHLSL
jgi:hypothetical protein